MCTYKHLSALVEMGLLEQEKQFSFLGKKPQMVIRLKL